MAKYEATLRRFAEWFNRYRQPDGSLDAPNLFCPAYMPVPLYAHATGDTDLLHRTLAYIERRAGRDAQFLRPPGKGLLPYRMAWIAIGAVVGEHLRLGSSLAGWISAFADRGTGGYFGNDATRKAGAGEICFDSTTNVCAALCFTGDVAEAERAGVFLRRLVQAQTESDARFFTVWDTSRGLVTQFEPKQARLYAIEWAQPQQYLYKIGLLVRAFALLHARTGNAQDLALAESMHRKAFAKSPGVSTNTLAHKLGWSAYTLFLATRKGGYVEDACAVADHLAGLQQPDGAFHYPEFWPPYEQVEIEQKFNIGCQFATWIAYANTLLKWNGMKP